MASTQVSPAPPTENVEAGKGKEGRARWGNHLEFLLATIGMAVGTGNVWRFPYLAQKNGGGAFLLPYCIMLAVEGIPLFYMELALGQRFQQGSIRVWHRIRPYFKGIGIAQIWVSFLNTIYFPVVMTWCIYYFYLSFSDPLKWTEDNCDKEAADYSCCRNDSSKYYWYRQAIEATDNISNSGGFVNHIVICWTISWIITYACLFKGPESTGKAAYLTTIFPYMVLISLFFRGVTLPNAWEGIKVFFTPDFKKLLDPVVWMEAGGQIFYSLGVGLGVIICFGSYNPVRNNCSRDATMISLINCGTSLFAGIVVYAILGYREHETGIKVKDTEGGPGLAFISYTTAVATMPLPQLWAAAFFIMMVMLALNSQFAQVEGSITPLRDFKIFQKIRREVLCLIMCCMMYLLGLPMLCRNGLYVFTVFDTYAVPIPLLFVGVFECIALAWFYGIDRFIKDIKYMTGGPPNIYWILCWRFISPAFIVIVLAASCITQIINPAEYTAFVGCIEFPIGNLTGTPNWTTDLAYPTWARAVSAFMVCIPISIIPIVAVMNWKAPIMPIPEISTEPVISTHTITMEAIRDKDEEIPAVIVNNSIENI